MYIYAYRYICIYMHIDIYVEKCSKPPTSIIVYQQCINRKNIKSQLESHQKRKSHNYNNG